MTNIDEQQDKRNELVWKVFLWALAVMIGVVLYQLRLALGELKQNEHRLTVIESTRCSVTDCSNLRNAISGLEAKVAAIPQEVPPKWFLDKVDKIERKAEACERRIWSKEGRDHENGSTFN